MFGLTSLVAANGLAIWLFAANRGSILEVLWIYWLQSVVIGVVNVWRILTTPLQSPQVHSVQTLSSTVVALARYGTAGFFVFHYGMFHLGYAVFLVGFSLQGGSSVLAGSISPVWILISGFLFGLHHLITFIIERTKIRQFPDQAPSLGQVMMRPYARIIPMHLIIIFGPMIASLFGNVAIFVVFMVMKTLADVGLFYRGVSHPGTINSSQPIEATPTAS